MRLEAELEYLPRCPVWPIETASLTANSAMARAASRVLAAAMKRPFERERAAHREAQHIVLTWLQTIATAQRTGEELAVAGIRCRRHGYRAGGRDPWLTRGIPGLVDRRMDRRSSPRHKPRLSAAWR